MAAKVDRRRSLTNLPPPAISDRKLVRRRVKIKNNKTPRPTGKFDYKEARQHLQEDLRRLKQTSTFLLRRLEHALQLVRKQRKRYAELVEGKTQLLDSKGSIIRYKFACVTCKALFNTFLKLKDHKHKLEKRATVKTRLESLKKTSDEPKEDYDNWFL